jgi:two-component system phosphate regulon response regulator OmpR
MNPSHPCANILVVDDDLRLRSLLESHLQAFGFAVHGLGDGRQVEAVLDREAIDLIILDLGLPFEDGLEICRRLRRSRQIPILMLTARGDEVDRILGLEMGADDYLPKPFNPRELIARIQAILRRAKPLAPAPAAPEELEPLRFGPFVLDFRRHLLRKDGEALGLTSGEFQLLATLARHDGQPLSRDQLMLLTRGRAQGPYDRSIDVQISRLRRLIERDPTHPQYIRTVWGHGYLFVSAGP